MLKNIKAVAFDLDGTIYQGNKLIEGAFEVINYLKEKNIKVYYLTNSSKTRGEVHKKLKYLGINCEINEVYSSGYLIGRYLNENNYNNVYIIGSEKLKEEIRTLGINIIENEFEAEVLVVAFDSEFNYRKMTAALTVALNNKPIITCNKERMFPGENGKIMPGCGFIIGAIEHCANRKSDIVVGKPSPYMLEELAKDNNLSKNEILMVGDTYESDIVMAKVYGCKSVLISKEIVENTVIINKLQELIQEDLLII